MPFLCLTPEGCLWLCFCTNEAQRIHMHLILHLGSAAASPPSPQDWFSVAVFTGPLRTVTAEGLVNREHTPTPVRFFCTGAHTPMTSKLLYHLPRIFEFRCWVKNEWQSSKKLFFERNDISSIFPGPAT